MADLFRLEGEQFFDDSGNPLNGGKLYYYDAGTTNARSVYQDSTALVPWTQPIELLSNGRLAHSIYVPTGAFKERLTTAGDVDIYTEDDIPGAVTIPSSTFAQPDIPVISKTTDYTITADDRGKLIKTDTTSGNVQLTLPSAVAAGDGFVVFVQHAVGANATTVVRAGADTLNGGSSVRLTRQWSSLMIDGDGGTAWTAMSGDFLFTTPAAKTTTYAVTLADVGKTILADATGGAFDVDLPPAATAGDGFEITVVKIDSSASAVTIDPDGAETVNDAATFVLSRQWQAVRLRCNGSAWYVVGEYVDPSVAVLSGSIRATGTISPTQLAADTDNWAPSGFATASAIRLSTDAARNLTGLAGGAEGRIIVLHNIGSNALVLKDEDTNSTDINRFSLTGTGVDFTLREGASCVLRYDGTTQRWRLIAAGLGAATQAAMETAGDGSFYVSPAVQHSHPGHPKMWGVATVSGGTPTLQTSYNVTSIADNGVGRLEVTVATDFSSGNWCAIATCADSIAGGGNTITGVRPGSKTVTVVEFANAQDDGSADDPTSWSFLGLGDQG